MPEQLRKIVIMSFVVLLIIIIYLFQHIHVLDTNYKIQNLENDLRNLRLENEKMQVLLSRDTALELIDQEAAKLGLIRPTKLEYIVITEPK